MATDAQQRATTENWAIYILKGMARIIPHTQPALNRQTYRILVSSIDLAIDEIKTKQELRIAKRSRK